MTLLKSLNLPPLPGQGAAPLPGVGPGSLAINKPGPFESGTQQQLFATLIPTSGPPQDVTGKVKWSSSDESLVVVLPGGLAKVGRGFGEVTITATASGGKPRDSIKAKVRAKLRDIVVTPANPLVKSGDIEILTATAVYEDGFTENVTASVEWSSDRPAVADFSSPGSCVANDAGIANIAATDPSGKASGWTKVTVPAAGKAPVLRKVTISPLNPDIKSGTPVQFKAMGKFSDNSTHEITNSVTWQSTHPDILAIDAKGLAKPRLLSGTPMISGMDQVTKQYQSTTVYVEMPPVKSLGVSPKDISVPLGATVEVTATVAFHGGGEMKANESVKWTPDKPNVAVITAGGNSVKGTAVESTLIEVLEPLSGQTDFINVTVLPPVPTMILISPTGPTFRVGDKPQFSATGVFSDGTSKDLVRPTWDSSNRGVLEIDASGNAIAKSDGATRITVQDRASRKTESIDIQVLP